ncbi:MAG: hypothetical protein Q8O40_00265 [Chloroflexota bacterium]|nr:hypothetical protein [Chloroflexota bacterium]
MIKPVGLDKPERPVAFFADLALVLERPRVAVQVRLAHLERQGRTDQESEELLRRVRDLEGFVDGRLGVWVRQHPTAKWWTRVKGAGPELMGKVIGLIEAFGHYYMVRVHTECAGVGCPACAGHGWEEMVVDGDRPWIPAFVQRKAVRDDEGRWWVWVEGIERLMTPSKLYKYAGVAPESKRRAGHLVDFNTTLRMMLFRLMTSFMRQTNHYYEHYVMYKEWKRAKLMFEGIRILPTPKARYCAACDKELILKAGKYCPDCGTELSGKNEPPGIIWEGHLDYMARRRAGKLFLAHLWGVWRSELKLPLRTPYPVEYMAHSQIVTPWEMCDRAEPEQPTT